MPMDITLIAALDQNGVIGADGGMPWHIPDDLKRFKRLTQGKTVVMGRKTFDSIGRPLPKRDNWVVTRDNELTLDGCTVTTSLESVIDQCRQAGEAELIVMGGAQIYAMAMSCATRLELTRIEARFDGDTYFPGVDWDQWQLIDEQPVDADGSIPAYRFMTWQRKAG